MIKDCNQDTRKSQALVQSTDYVSTEDISLYTGSPAPEPKQPSSACAGEVLPYICTGLSSICQEVCHRWLRPCLHVQVQGGAGEPYALHLHKVRLCRAGAGLRLLLCCIRWRTDVLAPDILLTKLRPYRKYKSSSSTFHKGRLRAEGPRTCPSACCILPGARCRPCFAVRPFHQARAAPQQAQGPHACLCFGEYTKCRLRECFNEACSSS